MFLVNSLLIPTNYSVATSDSQIVLAASVSTPIVTLVTPIIPALTQTIHIYGSGFGSTPPQTVSLGDGSINTVESSTTPYIFIHDKGGGSHEWTAGGDTSSFFDAIGIILKSWTDNEIILGGFGAALGTNEQGTWNIAAGDPLTINIITPNGSLEYAVTVTAANQTAGTVSDWSMFRGTPQHTGRSLYLGSQQGSLKWVFNAGDALHSSPAIAPDGTIYVGSNDGNIYAVNPDGSLKWNYATSGAVLSSPAIGADGTIYTGSNDGKIYGLNSDGTLKWSYLTISEVGSSPIIDPISGVIYVASAYDSSWHGRMYAFYPDGTLKWVFNPNTPGSWILSSPAVGSDGVILFGDYTNPSSIFWALNPNGTELWHTIIPSNGENDIYSSAAIDSSGMIYFGEGSSNNRLVSLYPNGTIAWFYSAGESINSSPALGSDGTIYFGSSDGKLYAVTQEGTLKWAYSTGAEIYSSPAIGADGSLYVGSNDGKIYAFSSEGILKWSYATGGSIDSSPSIGADGTLYASSTDGKLYAFQASTSEITSTPEITNAPKCSLGVVSAHGSPNPAVGNYLFDSGSSHTFSVASPVIEDGVNWTCVGWSGSGSVPVSGSGTTVTFDIYEDSSITWEWVNSTFRCRLSFGSNCSNYGVFGDRFYDYGAVVTESVPGVITDGNVNYTCVAWSANSGVIIGLGAESHVSFKITSDTRITWFWVASKQMPSLFVVLGVALVLAAVGVGLAIKLKLPALRALEKRLDDKGKRKPRYGTRK